MAKETKEEKKHVQKKQAQDIVLGAFNYFKTKADSGSHFPKLSKNNNTLSKIVAMEQVTTLQKM
jgi:hypothetical protein